MRDYPGRRYPRTPYAPRSEDTRQYRNGWDDGWDHLGDRGIPWAAAHYEGLESGPYKHGYLDGGDARLKRELEHLEAERWWREEWARVEREERLRRGEGDSGAW